jgi:hypothetical protein
MSAAVANGPTPGAAANPALGARTAGSAGDMDELAKLARDCAVSGVARRVLFAHFASLPAELRRPHHLRLLHDALEPMRGADRARFFALANGDMAVAWRGETASAASGVTAGLARLLADMETPVDLASIVRILNLPEDTALVNAAIAASTAVSAPPAHAGGSTALLDSARLAHIEHDLIQVNVSRFVRRKQIVERLPDGSFALRWEKHHLAVSELIQTLSPDGASQAPPWLFRRLTRTLDQRMLALLAAPHELRDIGPFSINLNIASILSSDFLRFDEALPAVLRGRVTLDLLPADLVADPGSFLFARNFAQTRGYRTLLRGIDADLLPMFAGAHHVVDLLQIRWSDALGQIDPSSLRPVAQAIVLTRATPEGIAWGTTCGIRYYQKPPGSGAAQAIWRQ